jgi:hypothetical protein
MSSGELFHSFVITGPDPVIHVSERAILPDYIPLCRFPRAGEVGGPI